jgi:exopolyphosphatase/guanosine-5'-triphosphate,3'-diphosphate pyrophosphatase
MILAGIDIGTNAIRLLVADIGESSLHALHAARTVTRLGEGLDRSGILSEASQARALGVLCGFRDVIRRFGPARTVAVGTSALRQASNAGTFIAMVKERCGIDLTVISGVEEARLTLSGVRRALARRAETRDPLADSVVTDIGGGSTELIVTRQGKAADEASCPLGAVLLTERYLKHDPPLAAELGELRCDVRQELNAWERDRLRPLGLTAAGIGILAGTAGTVTTLAGMDLGLTAHDPDRINGHRLMRSSLDGIVRELGSRSSIERRNLPGLERGREDIILAGAIIAQELMERCGAEEMLVSDWGLREGLLFDRYEMERGAGSKGTGSRKH